MRKLASQVPELVSRLQRAHIGASSPPTWFAPVIAHPPPVQPSRSSVPRTKRLAAEAGQSHSTEVPLYNDLFPKRWDASAEGGTRTHKSKHFRAPRPRPQAIVYEEDRIRRQFFRDFPYEALRPTSLVEGGEVGGERLVEGEEWTKLSQRGIYPTVEDTIAFTLNLHHVHKETMSDAYFTATHQFTELRALHELSTIAAEQEALAHGAVFKPSVFQRTADKEEAALSTLSSSSSSASSSTSTPEQTGKTSNKYRKTTRWTAATPAPLSGPSGAPAEFTAGRVYVENWQLPPPLAMSLDTATRDVSDSVSEGAAEGQVQQSGERSEKALEDMSDADVLAHYQRVAQAPVVGVKA